MEVKIMERGRLIAIEGTDGVGKTTLCHNLLDTLQSVYPGERFAYMANPNPQATLYKDIREMLKDPKTDPDLLQSAMAKNFMDLMCNIVSDQLMDGINVILDRWLISVYVYNKAVNGTLWKDLLTMSTFFSMSETTLYYKDEIGQVFDFQVLNDCFLGSRFNLFPDCILGVDMPLNIILEHSKNRAKAGAKEVNDTDQELVIKHYNLYNEVFDSVRDVCPSMMNRFDSNKIRFYFGNRRVFKYIYLRDETKSESELYTIQFKEAIEAIAPLFIKK